MTELAEDPGGHNLRARYKWRIVGGLVAAMVLNTWLVVRFNSTLARLLGIDPDVPLRDSHISPLAFACFVLLVFVWAVVPVVVKPVTFDPHRPLWSQWNELIVVGVWLVVITASMLLAIWSAVVIMAGVSLARGQLTAAEALALIRRGRSPKAWTRPEYRAGDRTFGDD